MNSVGRPRTSTKRLLEQLREVGFPEGIEGEVELNLLLNSKVFEVCYAFLDRNLHYQATATCIHGTEGLLCAHYQVTPRRYSNYPSEPVNGVDVGQLVAAMGSLNWSAVFSPCLTGAGERTVDLIAVTDILQQLAQLATVEEGRRLAEELKLRYWEHTPLQRYLGSASGLKASIETTQRYLIFEGQAPITLSEAFRYLNHRWQEKSWMRTQKQKPAQPGAPSNGRKRKTDPAGKSRKPGFSGKE